MAERTSRIDLRVAPDEVKMLQELAVRDGLTGSAWLRHRIRTEYRAAFGDKKPRMPPRSKRSADNES